MATPTYTLIDSVTLSSSATTVTFSSIDQSYRDLVLVEETIGTGSSVNGYHRFNSDSGSNYSYVFMLGNGSSTSSSSATSTEFYGANASATNKGFARHQILDYSATDKHKTILTIRTSEQADIMALAQRWANTSAVTSLSITTPLNQFAAGTTFHLYGISA